jgi:entericidin B
MSGKIIASILATLFLVAAVGTVTGCNTVEGAGKDIELGGKALRDEAAEHRSR